MCIRDSDNSWATPLYFTPMNHGIDISILAATKYISGHADTMLGLITVKNEKLFLKIKDTAVSLGDCPGPQECYLSLRGLRTLSARLEHHRSSALKIARLLENNESRNFNKEINRYYSIANEIYNELGPGFRETVYQGALAIELRSRKILYLKEFSFFSAVGSCPMQIFSDVFI